MLMQRKVRLHQLQSWYNLGRTNMVEKSLFTANLHTNTKSVLDDISLIGMNINKLPNTS